MTIRGICRDSLVLLFCAYVALAEPVLSQEISGRELEIRQDERCPSEYTSQNGLVFDMHCGKNLPFNDAQESPFRTDSMQDCMERCSRFRGNGEGCFGVVMTQDANNFLCWLKNSTRGDGVEFTNDPNIHTALVDPTRMEGYDETCPGADLSVHNLGSLSYTLHCGKTYGGYDTCWEGYPGCDVWPFDGFYHATSLEECLGFCVAEHPLCKAVTYNPNLHIGYANCWPKTDFPGDNDMGAPDSELGVMHTATITRFDLINTTCPEEKAYTATGDKHFEIHCGQRNEGTNMTYIHTQNITACLDTCAADNNGCVGIVFDSSLEWGYKNCVLKNTTSLVRDQPQATYAFLSGTPLPTSSATSASSDPSPSTSESKAWIAGPVVGAIAGIAIVVLAAFWWRRRKNRASPPAYAPYASGPNHYNDQPPMGLQQLDDNQYSELPTSTTVKYAHASEGPPTGMTRGGAPQELP